MSDNQRPDPDLLLAQLKAAEARVDHASGNGHAGEGQGAAVKGRLRIYFGASAGVGKTWAMLSAAQQQRAAGVDLVVGVVETHGRRETAALLEGLEVLPLRVPGDPSKGVREFDLDAALARKPAILLVDELAHSNVPGSRHAKRWQDVQELLAAGIEVWSALNVQHLESLNGTVGAITGIRVHETVPDTVLDEADEVILIDVTADELTARLLAGKVYLPEQAERARQNFFRKGNLIALREIALRRTAEHVEDDVRDWRIEHAGDAPGTAAAQAWNTSGAILACVGPDEEASQAVRTAARLAGQLNVRWFAAYVETPSLQRLPAARRDQVLAVLKLAEQLGASTAVLTGQEIGRELAAHAQHLNCATLVIGRGRPRTGWRRLLPAERVMQTLAAHSSGIDIMEVARPIRSRRLGGIRTSRSVEAADHEDADRPRGSLGGYLFALAASVGVTALAAPLSMRLELTNIVMLYLLGVVGIAMRFGRGPAAFAALLNVLAFDFFFVSPQLSFAVSDAQYVLTFAVMLLVGLVIGQLTAGLRFAAGVSRSRERRAQSLFELTRELSAALESSQVIELGTAAVQDHFGGQALVLTTDANDRLVAPSAPPEGFDASVADWVFRHEQPAGLATSTLAAQPWHYVPLKAPMRVRGVLALEPARPRWLLIPEQVQQLETLARQIATALERVHYVEVAQQAVVEIESERLRNALLGALSHDVRTPLTALIGLAESLQSMPGLEHGDTAEREAAKAIVEQAQQLHALVSNLLDMARLESGAAGGSVNLRRDWQSVEEVVGSAIRAVQGASKIDVVTTDLHPDLPLVEFDAVLIERVLVNLLENAAKYGRPPVEISARATPRTLQLLVRDHGAGLPPGTVGREDQLFEKFTRGAVESATPGVGLGLAICKAIVGAHGGSISARNAAGGGAQFAIELPRREPPEPVDPELQD
ncbi:fused sensory histidine kinase in two-component regulatory system with KdpE: signal sensing protein; sensory histidine kinase [Burkholderiales bacterium 8X]|nr:fused sensory histidine kinase in two-component regulatory system with KdpE: signal sensing protein; sensory histidine kinase [Burkholderiales bacterium 8X]